MKLDLTDHQPNCRVGAELIIGQYKSIVGAYQNDKKLIKSYKKNKKVLTAQLGRL